MGEELARMSGSSSVALCSAARMATPRERLFFSHSPAHSVYGVTFSPDGAALAYGGGYWYGDGYAGCLDSETGQEKARLDFKRQTVSAVCFDVSGTYLGASTWLSRHHHAPVYVLEFANGALSIKQEFHASGVRLDKGGGNGTATGISFWRGQVAVRQTQHDPAYTFNCFELPRGPVLTAFRPELTSSRLVAMPGALLSGTVPWRIGPGTAAEHGRDSELVLANPRGRTTTVYPLPYPLEYSALTSDAEGSVVLVGLSNGGLIRYRIHPDPEMPRLEELHRWQGHESAIMAACHLASPGHAATADLRGMVRIWDGQREVCSFVAPELSIRALAAHPTRPWLAVGGKNPGSGRSPGRVSVHELEL